MIWPFTKKWFDLRRVRAIEDKLIARLKAQEKDMRRIIREINLTIKVIGRHPKDPMEGGFLAGAHIENAVERTSAIYNELKAMKKLEDIEINEFVKAMKKDLGTDENKKFAKALEIEEDIRDDTLNLEKLLMQTIAHIRETGARGYLSNFLYVLKEHMEKHLSTTEKEVERMKKKRAAA